jgi:hypothetical protein
MSCRSLESVRRAITCECWGFVGKIEAEMGEPTWRRSPTEARIDPKSVSVPGTVLCPTSRTLAFGAPIVRLRQPPGVGSSLSLLIHANVKFQAPNPSRHRTARGRSGPATAPNAVAKATRCANASNARLESGCSQHAIRASGAVGAAAIVSVCTRPGSTGTIPTRDDAMSADVVAPWILRLRAG